jgi:hypothetical protein
VVRRGETVMYVPGVLEEEYLGRNKGEGKGFLEGSVLFHTLSLVSLSRCRPLTDPLFLSLPWPVISLWCVAVQGAGGNIVYRRRTSEPTRCQGAAGTRSVLARAAGLQQLMTRASGADDELGVPAGGCWLCISL